MGLEGRKEWGDGGGWVGLTDVGDYTGHDDLRLVGGPDGVAELGVVPGVDLALALDQRCVGIHVEYLLGQRAVGACYGLSAVGGKVTTKPGSRLRTSYLTLLGRGGHHDGDIKDLSEGRVRDHRVTVQGGVEVSGQVEESLLDVENQEQLSILLANTPQDVLHVNVSAA